MKTKITLLMILAMVVAACSIDQDENLTTDDTKFGIVLPDVDEDVTGEEDANECVSDADCSMPVPSNAPCNPPSNFQYETAQDGSWTSNSTWVGGNKPSTEDISNKKIKISHHVYIPNANIKLKDGSILYVTGEGSSLTLRNGNLYLEGDDEKAIFNNTILRTSGNIEQKENTYICMIDVELWAGEEKSGPNFVPGTGSTSANFKNDGGYRWLEGVCGNVTSDFQNKGTDYILDSCIDVGDRGNKDKQKDGQDSGNLQNEDGSMMVWNSEFYIANGDFQNSTELYICGVDYRLTNGNFQNSGSIEGEDLVIWIDNNNNGDIQSDGNWDGATLTLWRNDNGNNPEGISNLPDEALEETIEQCFGCECEASPVN